MRQVWVVEMFDKVWRPTVGCRTTFDDAVELLTQWNESQKKLAVPHRRPLRIRKYVFSKEKK